MRPTLVLALVLAGCGGSDATPDGGAADAGSQADAGGDASTLDAQVSTALGATPHPGGTRFAVWAPHADRVFVMGDWNAWSQTADELALGAGGVFAADVAGAAAGQQYQFVVHHGADVLTRNDPRARLVTSTVGKSVIVDPHYDFRAFRPAPRAEQVIYELHLGTFNATTATGGGTWRSAEARLDSLAALGVNVLEVMPPAEFPGDRSWGYNPSFPFAAESSFGTPDDMRHFIDAAHTRGLAVVIDVVYNHWGRRDLPMWCFDGDCLGAGGIYFYSDAVRANTPWGPRPDFGRAEVRDYITGSALLWLDEYRADGLRWDSTSNIRGTPGTDIPDGWKALREANDAVHQRFPDALEIAEDLQTIDTITKPTAAGGAGFDTQWDAAFFHPIDDTVITANDSDRSMPAIAGAITHRYNGHALERVIYAEDHDEVANGRQRIPQMISPSDPGSYAARKRSTLAAAVVLTAPGIPMLFMGQEFLESGFFADNHPLDWAKLETYAGIWQLYRDLVRLRKNVAGTTAGLTGDNVSVFHVNDGAKVLAYHRWKSGGPGDDVVVVTSFADRAFTAYQIGVPRAGVWHVRFNSDATTYGADYQGTSSADLTSVAGTRDGFAQSITLPLGRYEVAILSQ